MVSMSFFSAEILVPLLILCLTILLWQWRAGSSRHKVFLGLLYFMWLFLGSQLSLLLSNLRFQPSLKPLRGMT